MAFLKQLSMRFLVIGPAFFFGFLVIFSQFTGGVAQAATKQAHVSSNSAHAQGITLSSVNMDSYCQNDGLDDTGSKSGNDIFHWTCVPSGNTIDLADVCVKQHGQDAVDRLSNTSPNGLQCLSGAQFFDWPDFQNWCNNNFGGGSSVSRGDAYHIGCVDPQGNIHYGLSVGKICAYTAQEDNINSATIERLPGNEDDFNDGNWQCYNAVS